MKTNNTFNSITEIYDHILVNGKSVSLSRLIFDKDSQANDTNQRQSINDYCEKLAKEFNTDTDFSINQLKADCEPLYIEIMRAVNENVNFLPRLEFKLGLISIGGRFNRKLANFRQTTITPTKLLTMFFRIHIAHSTRLKAELIATEKTTENTQKANGIAMIDRINHAVFGNITEPLDIPKTAVEKAKSEKAKAIKAKAEKEKSMTDEEIKKAQKAEKAKLKKAQRAKKIAEENAKKVLNDKVLDDTLSMVTKK